MSKKNYLDNLNIDPRILGLGMTLCPFVANNSASRLDMFATHLNQFQIPLKGEHPQIFTGYESIVADYDFNTAEVKQDIIITDIIPRYRSTVGSQIQFSPYITVIYSGYEDGVLSYFNLHKHTQLQNEYGYVNIWKNEDKLLKDSFVEKGTRFYTSSARDGDEYKIGVNANVAYMSLFGTVEDAFVISQSLANKLTPLSIKTISVKIDPRQYPINLYGSMEEWKFFPDIGETVRDDGVLMAFRKSTSSAVLSDLNDDNMFNPQYLFDDCVFVSPKSMVIDVNVFCKKGKLNAGVYSQLKKYDDATIQYYKDIIEIYKKNPNVKISPRLNTLVTQAMSRLLASGSPVKGMKKRSNLEIVDKDKPISMQIDITVMSHKIVNNGFKLTGRDGAKGVVSAIWKDEDMPVDENGIRTDIIKYPTTAVKRTNLGQFNEQYICRKLDLMVREILENRYSTEVAFNRILSLLQIINPNYAQLVRDEYPTEMDKEEYLSEVMSKGISVNIPPSLNTITPDLIEELERSFDTKKTNVSFNIYDEHGNKQRKTTKEPILIGKKYIYLLYKMPRCSSCGGGFINTYKTPVHPNAHDELHFPIHQAPTRFGEDEFRLLFISVGSDAAVRLRTLMGNSLKGVNLTIQTILESSHPTQIEYIPISTKELKDDDFILSVVDNMFTTIGIDATNVLIPASDDDKDKAKGFEDIEELEAINQYLKSGI